MLILFVSASHHSSTVPCTSSSYSLLCNRHWLQTRTGREQHRHFDIWPFRHDAQIASCTVAGQRPIGSIWWRAMICAVEYCDLPRTAQARQPIPKHSPRIDPMRSRRLRCRLDWYKSLRHHFHRRHCNNGDVAESRYRRSKCTRAICRHSCRTVSTGPRYTDQWRTLTLGKKQRRRGCLQLDCNCVAQWQGRPGPVINRDKLTSF